MQQQLGPSRPPVESVGQTGRKKVTIWGNPTSPITPLPLSLSVQPSTK